MSEQEKTAKKTAAAKDRGPDKAGEQPAETAPRPDQVDDLSSAKAKPQQGAGGDTEKVRANIQKQQEEGSVYSGPNHDLPDPTPEHTARPPAGSLSADPESGRLEAPTDAVLQSDPVQGYGLSSTDHAYAAAGGRTIAGERFEGLVGEDGKSVSADSLFEDQDGKTFVTVKERVFEEFYYPNTTEKARRLLYVPGQRVNRAEAERIKAAMKG